MGFFEIDVLILRRKARDIASSMYMLHWIPGKNKLITPWYNSPDEPGVLKYPGWSQAHPYQLCYWWTLESDRRISYYRNLIGLMGGNTFELRLDEMLNLRLFNEMLHHFYLPKVLVLPVGIDNSYASAKFYPNDKVLPPPEYLDKLEQETLRATMNLQTIGVEDADKIDFDLLQNTIDNVEFKNLCL